ncbi:MAG: DUF3617 domain-containing protein [Verminephrobacter sp.]|nr:DUF3617 domain-containing protein [Verminephrobacter sp.]OGB46516.1 MAG: hypothetical protein A3F76_14225 [Burkholderiales bacterium RIFCSPLOWO2_12_FULL_65_40]HAU57310.1 DUF3617 domain-containing protein [Comamonadaceae bacterium]
MQISRLIVSTAALALLAGMAGGASAQQKMRPGLWEHSVNMKSQSGQMEAAMAEMQKSLASMPPEQRKQMEQMMAQQGVGMGPKGQTVKVCITKEQADLDNIPQQEGCTQKVQRVDASTMKVAFSCKGGQGQPPSSGEGTITMQGPTAYTGQFRFKTQNQGKPEQIDMAQSGKWLSENCGAIKPMPMGR